MAIDTEMADFEADADFGIEEPYPNPEIPEKSEAEAEPEIPEKSKEIPDHQVTNPDTAMLDSQNTRTLNQGTSTMQQDPQRGLGFWGKYRLHGAHQEQQHDNSGFSPAKPQSGYPRHQSAYATPQPGYPPRQ